MEIDFREVDVYNVANIGERFDVVFFSRVFYHLRHPLLALDLIHEHAAGDLLIFQSMIRGDARAQQWNTDYPLAEQSIFDEPTWPKMHFVESHFAGDPSNWWIPNASCVEALLRSSGFAIEQRPEDEVYLCRRVERPQIEGAVYPARSAPTA